jgi:GNAT superfamily N-acetyltransferase
MTDFDTGVIVNNLLNPRPGVAVFIAEDDEGGAPLGLIHLQTDRDFYTGEEHGHVTDLIVADGAEGRGVGGALLRKAEEWTRERGHRLLTLHVFERNARARELYERQGFVGDMFKYVKPLE